MKWKGFTLIELLVVVLIIGILSAIALPQYNKTVEKTRGTQALVLLKALGQAQEAYYLANGQYATTFGELDVSLPGEFVPGTTNQPTLFSDMRTNQDWDMWIDGQQESFKGSIAIKRASGPYKEAGFIYRPTHISSTTDKAKHIVCFEYGEFAKTAGAYCQGMFNGTIYSDTPTIRKYTISM